MFLKSLTLKGFKSFADSTTLSLEPGVTVVVGPNGSGKSNVVDAIAWVLGAQAPKSVRSQKMDDVIFAGTATRPALGRAEVSLTIDNSAGLLDVEFSEVTVSRILFRSGDSEYAINGVPCRLLDVQELLSDAGVGRQQHVIVSQGQIDAVLNARPEDRRGIIEEAAGVLKYRKRKEKAERRLDATEANLLRVQDLLREVRRQLRPLERQADAARRHGDLASELTELRVHVAGREIAALRSQLDGLTVTRRDTAHEEGSIKSELARLDTEVLAVEAELSARGASDLGDHLVRVEHLRERARGLAAVLVERRRSIERDRGQLLDDGVVASLEADAARLTGELEAVCVELAELETEHARLDAEDAQLGSEREAFESVGTEVATPRASNAAAEVRGELRSVRQALERSEGELRRAEQRRADLDAQLVQLGAEVERHREECATAESVEAPLVEALNAAEAARSAAQAAHESTSEQRQTSAEAASKWNARVEALQLALDAAHARAGAERLAAVDGVLGTLLDLVEIDQGWEAAVEAALGEALSAVVVEGPQAARRALDQLHHAEVSGAVLTLGPRRQAPRPAPVGEEVRPHVRTGRPGVGLLLDALIGGAVRVPDAAAGVEAALDHPDAVIVTSGGDRFAPSGWRVGAAAGGATAAALAEARDRADEARAALERDTQAVTEARAALESARVREAELARELDANDARFTAASEGLARAQGARREAHTERERLDPMIAELVSHIDAERTRVAELAEELEHLDRDERAEQEAAQRLSEARSDLDARASALAARRRDFDVRAAGLHERAQLLERRITETDSRLAANHEARLHATARREQLERALVAVDRLAMIVREHREVIEREHDAVVEQRRRQSDEVRALGSRLDTARRARGETERRLEELRETSRRAEIEHAEVTLRLENAIELLRRELDVEPEVALRAPRPDLPDGVNPSSRIRELERELRLLGPINPLALEEFTELSQRHTFLEEQLEDVRSSRRELTRVIRAIDAEIQQVFAGAFADVSINFTTLFGTLFPGGSGRLILTNPEDLLNTGIEVEAKPSGKNVKKLSLLSGGERSLTALAFLFAVFRSRPSPFYVMDEVEAALDDVNLMRFLSLVAEFRREAQLLIVSHQKRTMEAGDSLLGVSMRPGGSSKVVVERVAASA